MCEDNTWWVDRWPRLFALSAISLGKSTQIKCLSVSLKLYKLLMVDFILFLLTNACTSLCYGFILLTQIISACLPFVLYHELSISAATLVSTRWLSTKFYRRAGSFCLRCFKYNFHHKLFRRTKLGNNRHLQMFWRIWQRNVTVDFPNLWLDPDSSHLTSSVHIYPSREISG